MTAAIEVRDLSRDFGRGPTRLAALSHVTFEIEQGAAVALLGINGAGKTTLTKVLATLLAPTGGSASILGKDVVREAGAARRSTGVVFGGERGLYPRLSGFENLRFFGMLAGVARRDLRSRLSPLLEQVGLTAVAHRRVETYSKGMKQRLQIAIALVSEPRILLLDEPTLGLDPVEAQRLRDSIKAMRRGGVTVLLTSHHLLDVQELTDRVLLLDGGRVTVDESLGKFAARAGYAAVVRATVRGEPGLELTDGLDVIERSSDGEISTLTIRLAQWSASSLGSVAAAIGQMTILEIEVRPASLEDAFAHLSAGSGA